MVALSKADKIAFFSLTAFFCTAGMYALKVHFEQRTQNIIDSMNESISNLEETADNFKDVSEKLDLMIKDIQAVTGQVDALTCSGEASERLCQTIRSLRENGLPYYGEPKPFNDYMNFRA